MYLKYLTVKDKDGFVIRHVDFKVGVNIIKGDTTSADKKSNTNSIGKTTLLRAIDFCLAGKWQSLVYDQELKNTKNNTVFDFFTLTSPTFEIFLTDDLKEPKTLGLKISRNLLITIGKKGETKVSVKNFINNEESSDSEYKEKIKEYLFGTNISNPTTRQLIPKFIRASQHQISNIVKYLHPTTPNSEYEILHLFLFDFIDMDLIHKRITKENDLKQKNEQIKSLGSLIETGAQEVNDLRKNQVRELKERYDNYQISKEYERENDLLNLEKERLEKIKLYMSEYYLNIDIWNKRLEDLTEKQSKIDAETISYIYQEAGLYNVQLQKKYEETIAFHQAMLDNELEFINKTILKNKDRISKLQTVYALQSEKYSKLLSELGKNGSLAEYTALNNQINELNREIIESETILNSYQSLLLLQQSLKSELEEMNIQVNEKINNFRRKLIIFNKYFSRFSKDLSENGYLLVVENDKNKHFTLLPRPVDGDSHVGDGQKQSVIIAFDLAYVAFANDPSINIVRPHFFTQDKVEIMNNNVLSRLINLANDVACQFIFPVIKDKLDNIPDFGEENVILTLNYNDKFFDIENYYEKKQTFRNTFIEMSLLSFKAPSQQLIAQNHSLKLKKAS